MESEYWLKRWQEGRTGWHHDKPMPLLLEHWPALEVPREAYTRYISMRRVFSNAKMSLKEGD